jgi:hypothetical protein
VNALKEIEQAVKKLPPEELVKLAAWIDQHRVETSAESTMPKAKSGAEWFRVYMDCPDSFDIPPRKKQFYQFGR